MREDFLHYLWKHKKFQQGDLYSAQGEKIEIKNTGSHNLYAGPDFFNGGIIIDGQLWAGNIEIHIKSSDWYAHNHESDPGYDNVVLHVVWEHDTDVFRKDNTAIPVLELKSLVEETTLCNYDKLFSKQQKWINCEKDISKVDVFLLNNWLERLYVERLEQKENAIEGMLLSSNNDWDAVLFKMLAKSFGLNINGDAMLGIASSFDFNVLRKTRTDQIQLEALLFGQAQLLEEIIEEPYQKTLKWEYDFLANKFQLDRQGVVTLQFFRLRPNNFPTIRLSQLASLYHQQERLFSKMLEATDKEEYYGLFGVSASAFWDTHHTFHKTSQKRKKRLSKSFVDLLLINTIIPLKFCYAKSQGKNITDSLINLIRSIAGEKNSIVEKYKVLGVEVPSAMHSQGLIQLKKNYCDPNKCLCCAVGNHLIVDNF